MKECLCGYQGDEERFKPHIFQVERFVSKSRWEATHIWFYIECDNCGRHTKHKRTIEEAENYWNAGDVRIED